MERDAVLLSAAYCGPVAYFALIIRSRVVYLDPFEHYLKQSCRNRCTILGPNGPASLTIPVEHGNPGVSPLRDTRIAYHEPWQRTHWRTLRTAYGNSPFFEDYASGLVPFYNRRFPFLFDYNREYLLALTGLLGLEREVRLTSGYGQVPEKHMDYRAVALPGRRNCNPPGMLFPAYTQVFEDKFPFVPNLSILDLLFNTGPQAVELLLLSAGSCSGLTGFGGSNGGRE